jgi:ABC-type bacteriocin/lantibiotic exporter with double-glycine peptidase domain
MLPLRRFRQISPSHCGPAVLQSLLNFCGCRTTQKAITQAAQLSLPIDEYGTTYLELAQATHQLFPQLLFWYKFSATFPDLDFLINHHSHPVVVEWQGVFLNGSPDDDNGHYSLVSGIDLSSQSLTLIDPYGRQAHKTLSFGEFQPAWWDTTLRFHPQTHQPQPLFDHRLIFTLTSQNTTFPKDIQMTTL